MNPGIAEPSRIRTPRALRHGDPNYWNSLYRSGVVILTERAPNFCGTTTQGCPTRTTPTVTVTQGWMNAPRSRLPCESFSAGPNPEFPGFNSGRIPLVSEFQHDDRMSTTNLIDWTLKESWTCGALRAGVFRSSPLSPGSGDFRPGIANEVLTTSNDAGRPASRFVPDSDNEPGRYRFTTSVCESGVIPPCTASAWTTRSSEERGLSGTESSCPSRVLCEFSSDSLDSNSTASSIGSPVGFLFGGLRAKLVTTSKRLGTSETTYSCDYPSCCKTFSRKEELSRHRRTHGSERAYQCRICHRKFIRRDHMTKHLATHEDVATRKRYTCNEPGCDRRYTRSDALSRHRSAAHGFLSNHPLQRCTVESTV